jgi:hypothetical protein
MADTNTMQLVDTSGLYEIGRLANAFNDLVVNLPMKQEVILMSIVQKNYRRLKKVRL